MTSRKMLTATLAALVLIGATASAANARHHGRRMHPAMDRTGRTSQDNMADRLNAQSLQQTRGGMPQGAVPPQNSAPPGALPQ